MSPYIYARFRVRKWRSTLNQTAMSHGWSGLGVDYGRHVVKTAICTPWIEGVSKGVHGCVLWGHAVQSVTKVAAQERFKIIYELKVHNCKVELIQRSYIWKCKNIINVIFWTKKYLIGNFANYQRLMSLVVGKITTGGGILRRNTTYNVYEGCLYHSWLV